MARGTYPTWREAMAHYVPEDTDPDLTPLVPMVSANDVPGEGLTIAHHTSGAYHLMPDFAQSFSVEFPGDIDTVVKALHLERATWHCVR